MMKKTWVRHTSEKGKGRRTVTTIDRNDQVTATKLRQIVEGKTRHLRDGERDTILLALNDLANDTEVNHEHPALVEPLFLLMVSEMNNCARNESAVYHYTVLSSLLDRVGIEPETKGGKR
jgi:hypothetical protein